MVYVCFLVIFITIIIQIITILITEIIIFIIKINLNLILLRDNAHLKYLLLLLDVVPKSCERQQ